MDYNRLALIIKGSGIPLGTSAHGAAWCLAALHPAHPVYGLSSIPDNNCVSSCMVNFKSQYSISAPAGTTNAWSFEAAVLPNVWTWLVTTKTNDAAVPVVSPVNYSNNQIVSAVNWRNLVTAARLAYLGVTIFVDTPALADQGTLVASQVQQNWVVNYNTAQPYLSTYAAATVTYDNLINLPGTVSWVAREGAYLPLRLINSNFMWREQATQFSYAGVIVGGAATGATPQCLDSLIGVVSIKNLSPLASLRITIRMGVQCQSPPASVYSPFLSSPLPGDSDAIKAYFAVSAQMSDAYPSSYNDWGTLWSVIKKIAGPILKGAIGAIPKVGPALIPVVEGVSQLIKDRRVKRKSNGNGNGNGK